MIQNIRLILALLLSLTMQAQGIEPATVRIGVFSLFHPRILILTARQPLMLSTGEYTLPLDPDKPVKIEATDDAILVAVPGVETARTRAVAFTAGTFTLSVPGKLSRDYLGALSLTARHSELFPVVAMPTEVAVASIVQAESPPNALPEALKAQAVVSRSFLLAHRSAHVGFDACDTTHCQFLRAPPPAGSRAFLATAATSGVVLLWRSSPEAAPVIVPAMYSRSCGGHTHPISGQPGAYPFYRVACSYCLRHPERWHRAIDPSQVPKTEQERLAYGRVHGWSAIPSTTYLAAGEQVSGRGTGHGVGMCQLGAADMAAHGAGYEMLVRHFFPNTTLVRLSATPE